MVLQSQAGAGLDPAGDFQAILYSGDHTGRIEALAACIDVNPLKFQGLSVGHNVLKQWSEFFFVNAELRRLSTHLHREGAIELQRVNAHHDVRFPAELPGYPDTLQQLPQGLDADASDSILN